MKGIKGIEDFNEKTVKYMNCMNGSDRSCIKCLLYEACYGDGDYVDRLNKAAEGLE